MKRIFICWTPNHSSHYGYSTRGNCIFSDGEHCLADCDFSHRAEISVSDKGELLFSFDIMKFQKIISTMVLRDNISEGKVRSMVAEMGLLKGRGEVEASLCFQTYDRREAFDG